MENTVSIIGLQWVGSMWSKKCLILDLGIFFSSSVHTYPSDVRDSKCFLHSLMTKYAGDRKVFLFSVDMYKDCQFV